MIKNQIYKWLDVISTKEHKKKIDSLNQKYRRKVILDYKVDWRKHPGYNQIIIKLGNDLLGFGITTYYNRPELFAKQGIKSKYVKLKGDDING